jgi:PAS domain-containing protein
VPYFICPNCRRRSLDHDSREGLTQQAVSCSHCGFGFLFELLDDYYPAPGTGFVVCDHERRILASGDGVFELTGYKESDLLGREVVEVLGLGQEGASAASTVVEWGVRKLGQRLPLRTRSGIEKEIKADFFPAYDTDGGLLVALVPG